MGKLLLTTLGIVTLAAAGIFAYWTISPILRVVEIQDKLPEATSIAQKSTSTMEAENPFGPFTVRGTAGHPAKGDLRIIEAETGTTIRYENFETLNGPDLFVYLSKDLDAKEFVSLGEIRGTAGNINYAVPAGVDLSEYRYVLTWCKAFGVLFNYAEIRPAIL